MNIYLKAGLIASGIMLGSLLFLLLLIIIPKIIAVTSITLGVFLFLYIQILTELKNES